MISGKALTGRWAACTLLAVTMGTAASAVAQSISGASETETVAASSQQNLLVAERVRAKLMQDGEMEGVELLVQVMNGTVQMLGVARDQAQAERAVALALEIPGVSEVVHHIEVEGLKPTGLSI